MNFFLYEETPQINLDSKTVSLKEFLAKTHGK